MFIDLHLKDDLTCAVIVDWFKMGVFKRLFSASRLLKFHDRATSALKFLPFQTWSSYASDVSKEALVDILKHRDEFTLIDTGSPATCKFCGKYCYLGFGSEAQKLYFYCYLIIFCAFHIDRITNLCCFIMIIIFVWSILSFYAIFLKILSVMMMILNTWSVVICLHCAYRITVCYRNKFFKSCFISLIVTL